MQYCTEVLFEIPEGYQVNREKPITQESEDQDGGVIEVTYTVPIRKHTIEDSVRKMTKAELAKRYAETVKQLKELRELQSNKEII